MVQLLFSQIQQAPCLNFRKVGKSLLLTWVHTVSYSDIQITIAVKFVPNGSDNDLALTILLLHESL